MKITQYIWIPIIWIFLHLNAYADGVAVTKEQRFHADSSAKPFIFKNVRDYGMHVIFEVAGREVTVERTKFLAFIEVPTSIPDNIVNSQQLDQILVWIKNIEAFSTRYTLAKPLLRATLESLRSIVQSYQSGLVFYQKKWMLAREYEGIQQQLANEAAETQRQLAAEEKARKELLADFESKAQKEMHDYSHPTAEYEILERSEDGAIIKVQGVEDPDTLYFLGDPSPDQGNIGSFYKTALYFGGIYGIASDSGLRRNVRTYFRNQDQAIGHLRDRFYIGKAVASPYSSSDKAASYKGYRPGYGSFNELVWVNGYFRTDGTWVTGHYRKPPGHGDDSIADYRATLTQPNSTLVRHSYPISTGRGSVSVRGYYRKSGIYVRPHTRSR